MKKLYYLIILTVILGLVLTGCFLSNVGQVPTTGQSGISYLTKDPNPPVLVARWKFDEGSGFTAYDDSSNSNDGEITGASYIVNTMSGFGTALEFDGVSDFIQVPDSTSLDITSSITVEGWIKLTSFSQPATVAGKWKDIGGTNQRGYLLTVATDGTPRFYVSTNGVNYPRATGSAISLHTWYHLAGTYDGTNINLYVGTTPSLIVQAGSIFLNDQPLLIGANDGYGSTIRKFTNGVIDEVRIWSSVLEASQLDDMTAPTIKITTPADGATYLINEAVTTDWIATDDGTGVASESETVPIDTSTAGKKTFEVTATDYAGNEGSASVTYYVLENFVTGGGKINKSTLGLPGKGAALTFAGTIGVLDGEGIVGQFQIVGHTELDGIGVKGAVSLHCSNFTYLEFSGVPAESPAATHNIAIFEGWFTSNRGDIETLLLKLQIIDNGEPGAGFDTFCFCDPGCDEFTIDGGNFQVHDIEY